MYERTYGYLYERNRLVKEDAALIRRTIKTLTKGGFLPADWTYSCRYRSYSGGCSIDVTAVSPRPIYAAEPDTYGHPWALNIETGEHVHAWKDRLTVEARTVLDTLNELHQACNHDGCETQVDYFDVKFYGHAEVSGPSVDGSRFGTPATIDAPTAED